VAGPDTKNQPITFHRKRREGSQTGSVLKAIG